MKLDLHGIKHGDVRVRTVRFIEKYLQSEDTLHIVTGHSVAMKGLVISVLDEYGLEYKVGGYVGINKGYIEVYL